MKTSETASANHCIHCSACTNRCLFLKKYGMDLSGFAKRADLSRSCFLCGDCGRICPAGIDGAQIALQSRKREGNGRDQTSRLMSAERILLREKSPYLFRNHRHGKTGTVFFPGCNFTGFYPRTTGKLMKLLRDAGIGTVFDCCAKPLLELGRADEAKRNLLAMEKSLRRQGVTELLLACPNCYYFLKVRSTFRCTMIYEKLPELTNIRTIKRDVFHVYTPCPDRDTEEVLSLVKSFLDGEIRFSYQDVQCCGSGGCASVREPELAKQMRRIAAGKETRMTTYCATCAGTFQRGGVGDVEHILPVLLGTNETPPANPLMSLLNRAIRRL